MIKKDITKDYQANLEKVWDELNKLNEDMFENNQHSLEEAMDAYKDYRMSLNYN